MFAHLSDDHSMTICWTLSVVFDRMWWTPLKYQYSVRLIFQIMTWVCTLWYYNSERREVAMKLRNCNACRAIFRTPGKKITIFFRLKIVLGDILSIKKSKFLGGPNLNFFQGGGAKIFSKICSISHVQPKNKNYLGGAKINLPL